MAKGGKRPGAGRPRGSLTRRTQEVAARAIAENRTPLEIMLENMLHFQQAAIDAEAILKGLTAEEFTGTEMTPEEQFRKLLAEVKKAAGLRLMAQECARDAAPFVHPRLSATSLTVEKRDATDWTRDELVAILNHARNGGNGATAPNGRGDKSDSVH